MKKDDPPGSHWGSSTRMAAASRWERPSAEMGRGATDALLDIAQPRPGMQVLDVACGSGAPALPIARLIAPTGHVTATDITPDPLLIAAERARERGLTNITFQRADAQALPFEGARFDLVTCRFGVMFFPDLARALGEMHRVLRPGGRVALLAWGPFEQPYFGCTAAVVMRHTGAALPPSAQAMFKFAAPGTLAAALRQAGFRDAEDETRSVPWTWPETVAELWGYFQAVTIPFRPLLEQIRPEQHDAVTRDVHAALQHFWDGKQVNLTAQVVLASAVR